MYLISYRKVNGDFSGVYLSLFFELFKVKGNMKVGCFDIEGDANRGTLELVNIVGGNSTFQFGTLNLTNFNSI